MKCGYPFEKSLEFQNSIQRLRQTTRLPVSSTSPNQTGRCQPICSASKRWSRHCRCRLHRYSAVRRYSKPTNHPFRLVEHRAQSRHDPLEHHRRRHGCPGSCHVEVPDHQHRHVRRDHPEIDHVVRTGLILVGYGAPQRTASRRPVRRGSRLPCCMHRQS